MSHRNRHTRTRDIGVGLDLLPVVDLVLLSDPFKNLIGGNHLGSQISLKFYVSQDSADTLKVRVKKMVNQLLDKVNGLDWPVLWQ